MKINFKEKIFRNHFILNSLASIGISPIRKFSKKMKLFVDKVVGCGDNSHIVFVQWDLCHGIINR